MKDFVGVDKADNDNSARTTIFFIVNDIPQKTFADELSFEGVDWVDVVTARTHCALHASQCWWPLRAMTDRRGPRGRSRWDPYDGVCRCQVEQRHSFSLEKSS